jgi:hypothetical protein
MIYKPRKDKILKRAKKFAPVSMEAIKKAIDKADKRLNGDQPCRTWFGAQKARNKS